SEFDARQVLSLEEFVDRISQRSESMARILIGESLANPLDPYEIKKIEDAKTYRKIRERDKLEIIGSLQPPTFKSAEQSAREIFERDVNVLRHLVFIEYDEAPEGITPEAEKIA